MIWLLEQDATAARLCAYLFHETDDACLRKPLSGKTRPESLEMAWRLAERRFPRDAIQSMICRANNITITKTGWPLLFGYSAKRNVVRLEDVDEFC